MGSGRGSTGTSVPGGRLSEHVEEPLTMSLLYPSLQLHTKRGLPAGREPGGKAHAGIHVPWPSQGSVEEEEEEDEEELAEEEEEEEEGRVDDEKARAKDSPQKSRHASGDFCVWFAVQVRGRVLRQLPMRLALTMPGDKS